jgi:hypothetical protein
MLPTGSGSGSDTRQKRPPLTVVSSSAISASTRHFLLCLLSLLASPKKKEKAIAIPVSWRRRRAPRWRNVLREEKRATMTRSGKTLVVMFAAGPGLGGGNIGNMPRLGRKGPAAAVIDTAIS